MKYFKRLGIYKASNVTFNPTTKQAYSYGWWRFTEVIGGKLVFNDYRYSLSTGKHQGKVRSLLVNELGITPDVYIECPEGLQNMQSGITLLERRNNDLLALINKPGTRKAKNIERQEAINWNKAQIKLIKKLIKEQL